jgi:hypothetical protein
MWTSAPSEKKIILAKPGGTGIKKSMGIWTYAVWGVRPYSVLRQAL